MTVERRYSKRYPVDFRVKYRYRDLGPCASQALDLSLQGMLLATESTSPPAGVLVEITFSLAGYSWKIPGFTALCGGPIEHWLGFAEHDPHAARSAAGNHRRYFP